MTRFSRGASWIFVSVLVLVAVLDLSVSARASLQRPTYTAGDRWMYILQSSINQFPGSNATQNGSFHLSLVGRVEIKVIGSAAVVSGGLSVPAVRVDSSTSGFLNGSFSVAGAGGGTGQVTGSFSSSTTEYWENQSYFPIESHVTADYVADVTFIITTPLWVHLRMDATTSVSSIPPFNLDVGQSETANLGTHLDFGSTVTVLGQTRTSQNQTNVSSTWRRTVLSREDVTVEAGIFSSYKLNQTLLGFPGIPTGVSGSSNETAYFSNDIGYYTKRVAYANGTPVAEMRLKSFTPGGVVPFGPSALEIGLLIAIPVAFGLIALAAFWRRRRARKAPQTEAIPSEGLSSGFDVGGGGKRAR